jgi:hypothetical protein
MPKIVKSAWADPARFMGDIRTLNGDRPTLIRQYYTVQDADGNDVTMPTPDQPELGLPPLPCTDSPLARMTRR